MLEQELEIHLPYPGHLVQQDQGLFKKRIDFLILGDEDGGV